mmetsp:Transcript_9909/g.21388  ORF Transcript_9909/g.21388 Transcript_9909/m.21388 type:complete len:249 (+) Transcript_9909:185-931(+)
MPSAARTRSLEDDAKSILLSSPPGQFDKILGELRTLWRPGSIGDDFVASVRGEWEACTGRSTLLGRSANSTPALGRSMDEFIASQYSSPSVCASWGITRGGGDEEKIIIYAEKIDAKNSIAGSWKSNYTISADCGTVSGNTVVCTLAFESGANVQLHSTLSFDQVEVGPPTRLEDEALWAKSIIDRIRCMEDEAIEKLNSMFSEVSTTSLKRLRRVMPVIRTKFDWDNSLSHHLDVLRQGHDKNKFKH